jgi:ankyrin repeat protein
MAGCRAAADWRGQILLGQGADSEAFDGLGNTALHYASAYGHLKV